MSNTELNKKDIDVLKETKKEVTKSKAPESEYVRISLIEGGTSESIIVRRKDYGTVYDSAKFAIVNEVESNASVIVQGLKTNINGCTNC